MIGTLSQRSLHNCTLRYLDQVIKGSVFPLFDNEGRTHSLMLVSSSDPRIFIADFAEDLFVGRTLFPRLRPQSVSLRQTELQDGELTVQERIEHLWHYDPWWVLANPMYATHPLVPILKATNLVGHDPSIASVRFSKNLGRVRWITLGSGRDHRVKRFQPLHFARAKASRWQVAPTTSASDPAKPAEDRPERPLPLS